MPAAGSTSSPSSSTRSRPDRSAPPRRCEPPRRILLAAPYSGYATTVLSGLIAALIEDAKIIVTDWRDARLVPTAAGGFDLADQTRLLARLMRENGPGLHVIALSQAAVPALLATAASSRSRLSPCPFPKPGENRGRLRASACSAARSIRASIPRAANHLLLSTPPAALESTWLRTVDAGYPGAGRRVLPSLHHLLLFAAAHPEPYLRAQFGAFSSSRARARRGRRARFPSQPRGPARADRRPGRARPPDAARRLPRAPSSMTAASGSAAASSTRARSTRPPS